MLCEATWKLVLVFERVAVELLHHLAEESVGHGGSLNAKSSLECAIETGGSTELVAEVLGNCLSIQATVEAHVSSSDEVLVGGLTLDKLP